MEKKEKTVAFYEGRCAWCHKSERAELFFVGWCVPPPSIRATHQCRTPVVAITLSYTGSEIRP